MKGFSCFLIDDDSDDREIFEMALNEADENSSLVAVNSGYEALNFLKSNKNFNPDFIFIDLNMAIMDGIECFHELKKLPWHKTPSIIFYSTSSFENDINKTQVLGSDHFITKPSRIDDLSGILKKLFNGGIKRYYLNE